MNVTIDLTPEEEARLQAMAAQEGIDVSEYARRLVRSALPVSSPDEDKEEEKPYPDALSRAVAAMTNRTPAQIAEARARTLATYQPRRPLSPGKTFSEVISGKWPGDETDEQVQAALDELS